MQMLNWLPNLICVLVWITAYLWVHYKEELFLPGSYMSMVVIGTIMRNAVIALRYATTTDQRLEDSYDHVFSDEENNEEFLILAWIFANVKVIDQEIRASMVRN